MNLAQAIQFSTKCTCGSCKICKAIKAQTFVAPDDVDPKVPGASKNPFGGRIHNGKIGKRTEGGQRNFAVQPRRVKQRLSKQKLGSVVNL
jgi:hypothetical protein